MRLYPRSLGGQLVALLLIALVVTQAVSFLVFSGDRAEAIRRADRFGLLESTATVMRVLQRAPPEERAGLAAAASSRRIRFWVSADSAVIEPIHGPGSGIVSREFQRMFPGGGPGRMPRLALVDAAGEQVSRRNFPGRRDDDHWERFERLDVMASVPFQETGWLNAETRIRAETVPYPWPTGLATLLMIVAILAIVGLTARRVTRPARALAAAADAIGRGEPHEPLAETGPDELRRLTVAFNRMEERLRRFIADRTRMLAAIGHDLRTPITSLRLRAELIDDEDARAKMLATLEDMQRMTEATLAFAREDAAREPARAVDLAALIASTVDDLADVGDDVAYAGPERLVYRCRPAALKRALVNLIQNAIRYGTRARVALVDRPGGPLIQIDDDGPGIPADRIDDALQPFVRLETSRNRETGGVGLGLSIARSIVLEHGGELTLANRAEGGLRASISLPAA